MYFTEQVSAFSANYSDSGLFGIYTISQAAAVTDVSVWCWLQEPAQQHLRL